MLIISIVDFLQSTPHVFFCTLNYQQILTSRKAFTHLISLSFLNQLMFGKNSNFHI